MAELWNESEIAIARKLKSQHRTILEIAQTLSRSYASVQKFFQREHRRKDYWNTRENQVLADGLKRGLSYAVITEMIGTRTEESVRKRANYLRIKEIRNGLVKSVGSRSFIVPAHVIAERNKRNEEPMTLTQVLMGDPPFSRSALNKV